MNPTIFFSVISMFYCILLIIMVTGTQKIDAVSKKILKYLMGVNLLTLLSEVVGIFLGNSYKQFPILNGIVLRLMLALYIIWFCLFVLFVINIAKKEKSTKVWPVYILMLIGCVLTCVLPLNYVVNKAGVIIYSTGPATDIVKYFNPICNTIGLVIMFSNIKKIKISNYSSLFVLIITSTIAGVIQTNYPSILLVSSAETFVAYVIFYTIMRNNIKGDK